MHGFTGAVNAAFSVDEGIKPTRRGTATDAAVGEVEGRSFEAEEGVIAFEIARRDHGGRDCALAAR